MKWLSENSTTSSVYRSETFNHIADEKWSEWSETGADVCVCRTYFNIQMNFQRDTKLICKQIWELHTIHSDTHIIDCERDWEWLKCAGAQQCTYTLQVCKDKIIRYPLCVGIIFFFDKNPYSIIISIGCVGNSVEDDDDDHNSCSINFGVGASTWRGASNTIRMCSRVGLYLNKLLFIIVCMHAWRCIVFLLMA